MEIYNLPDTEFNTVVLRRLSELQESTEGQSNEIRQIIHKWNKKFSREIAIVKKKKDNLKLKNTVSEMKKKKQQRASVADLIKQKKESVK